jgi:hypothetical protein
MGPWALFGSLFFIAAIDLDKAGTDPIHFFWNWTKLCAVSGPMGWVSWVVLIPFKLAYIFYGGQ